MPCYETTFGWNRTHDHLMHCLGHQRFHQIISVFFQEAALLVNQYNAEAIGRGSNMNGGVKGFIR